MFLAGGDELVLRIAVDAMGGDYAPLEIIKGVIDAVERVEGLEILLVGRAEQLNGPDGKNIISPRISIVHAEEIIGNNEDPGLAIRSKRNASMVVALELVRQGRADAMLSCGSTGALMAGGLLFLGKISGIKRPALLTIISALGGEQFVILDIGANMDARLEQMLQYALMGAIYARRMLGIESPRIALLNVGVEENKGNQQVKSAYGLFKRKLHGFVGNLEAKEIFAAKADVVVCDGFAGNVMLKVMEGISREIFLFLGEQIAGNAQTRAVAPQLAPLLQSVRAELDEAEYGGALLIGLNGICIKCHGASRQRAISQAIIRQVYPLIQRDINREIELALTGGWFNEEADDEKG
ncbi:MAG TPA: phosphate acyltransferase PlsX [Firmicutes bacterium]|nr:phosphate acyltransferase PlsX [Bacillota bacterium]